MQKYHFCPSPFTAGFLPCYRNIILFSLRVLLECVVFSCCYGDPFLVVMKHRNSTSHLFLECDCGGLKKKTVTKTKQIINIVPFLCFPLISIISVLVRQSNLSCLLEE